MPQVTTTYLEQRRQEILSAAHRCFAERGFRDTTMQHVADEAGLSVGALYRYFDGKERLIEALAEGGRAQKREVLETVEARGVEGLLELVSRLLAQLPAGPEAGASLRFDVRIWGEALGHEQLQPLVAGALRELRDPIAGYVREEQSAGRMRREVKPATVAHLIVSLLVGLELQVAFDPRLNREAYSAGSKRLFAEL